MRILIFSLVLLSSVMLSASRVHAQGALPVVFELDDPRDGLWEAITERVVGLHLSEGAPVVIAAVPCGQGSTLDPYECRNDTGFHLKFGDWMRMHPALVEVAQHGLTHIERLAELSRDDQRTLIQRGLDEMAGWNLPRRPFAFTAPFASSNADTVSVLEELEFHTSIENSGDCDPSGGLDDFCNSISLCELDSEGRRVAGPECVLRSPDDLLSAVEARRGEGKVFLVSHPQDFLENDLETPDEDKLAALRQILRRFRRQEAAGALDLMTMDTFYRQTRGIPPLKPTCAGVTATIAGTRAAESISGTPGPDVIVGRGGADRLDGRGGDDVVCGGGGDDTILGRGGADLLFGQGGNDVIRGGKGDDFLRGGPGDDTLIGQRGQNDCLGGGGRNVLRCD